MALIGPEEAGAVPLGAVAASHGAVGDFCSFSF